MFIALLSTASALSSIWLFCGSNSDFN